MFYLNASYMLMHDWTGVKIQPAAANKKHVCTLIIIYIFVFIGTVRAIFCYNCTYVRAGTAAESSVTAHVSTPGCSNLKGSNGQKISARPCSKATDVCGYVKAKFSQTTTKATTKTDFCKQYLFLIITI